MKTIKRSIALVLAMILTLAMSVTVFAEGEGAKKAFTITVNEAKAGHTYEAYQILKGDLSKSETTLSNVGWGTGIKADKQTDLAKDAKAYVEKLSKMQSNSSDIKAEAQKIASALSTTVAGSVSVAQDNAKAGMELHLRYHNRLNPAILLYHLLCRLYLLLSSQQKVHLSLV